jgi:hypothetical protein
MSWNLTNPALQYEQPPQTDPSSGLPINIAAILRYFKNPALRAEQFAKDASQAVQPSISTVDGTIGEPSVSQGADVIPGPLSGTAPSFEATPGQDQTTVGMHQPSPILPKFVQPKFQDVSQGPNGLPTPVNAGETKLGKLLHVIRLAAEGAADGSQAGTFGGGFAAAEQGPIQKILMQQNVLHGQLENQLTQAQIGMLPWQRAAQIAAMQKTQAEAARAPFITPRGGGVFDTRSRQYLPGAGPREPRDLVEQRRSFAEDHADMFTNDHEKNNFVLYGHAPAVATTNPNEWQLRVAAAGGDPEAQAVLDQRFSEEKTLAGIRGRTSADNRASKERDAADAEQIASTILNAASGDPDKALKLFDQHSGKITDPDQRRLGPSVRKAIRARRQINRPQSALDKIISGDLEGGLHDMQEPTQ